MHAFKHKHGTTAEKAKNKIAAFLRKEGYDKHVTWEGNNFSASVGMGLLLNLKGNITDDEFIIENCSGAIGGKVLEQCKKIASNF